MTQRQINKIANKDNLLTIDMFGVKIYFFNKLEDFRTICEWRSYYSDTIGTGLFYHSVLVNNETKEEDSVYLIGVFNKELSTLVHEATHCGLAIIDYIGHSTNKNDEILPYLIGHIVNNFKDKL